MDQATVRMSAPVIPAGRSLADTLHAGMCFSTIEQARMIIKHWAKANRASYSVRKSEARCWLLVCKDRHSCRFRIRVKAAGMPTISILRPHTCPEHAHLDWRLPFTQPHYDPSLRAQLMKAANIEGKVEVAADRSSSPTKPAQGGEQAKDKAVPEVLEMEVAEEPVLPLESMTRLRTPEPAIDCSWHNIHSKKGFTILRKRCVMTLDKLMIAIGNDVTMGDYSLVNLNASQRLCIVLCTTEKHPDSMRSWPLWAGPSDK